MAIVIETYEALQKFLTRFVKGHLTMILLEGRPGVGKSYAVREMLKDTKYFLATSHITPMELYRQMWKHREEILVMEEIELLMSDPIRRSLIKQVSNSDVIKNVSYYSTADLGEGVPQSFDSNSRIVVLTNRLDKRDLNMQGVIDRGWHLVFSPSRDALLTKMEEITLNSPDNGLSLDERKECFNFIKKNCMNVKDLSLRHLTKSWELYSAWKKEKIDWQEDLMLSLNLSPKMILMNQLLMKDVSDKERIELWEQQGNWSRASYFIYKKLCKEA